MKLKIADHEKLTTQKMLKIIAIMLIPLSIYSQNLEDKENFFVAGFHAGYTTTTKNMTAGLQLGYRLKDFYLNVNQMIPLTTNAATPRIIAASLGYNIGPIQPFISYVYQTLGKDKEKLFKGTEDEFKNGFKTGYGLSFYFKRFPLSITAQRQGKENNFSVMMYKSL